MATVIRGLAVAVMLVACGSVDGFEGDAPPLVTFTFEVAGDFESVRLPDASGERLRVALVWGAQWLPEALCVLPPGSPEVAAAIDAGCRDPFGFVPDRASTVVEALSGQAASLPVFALPSADVMVGDVTGRIAYAALVVFDDRDGDDLLLLARARDLEGAEDDHGPEEPDPIEDPITKDIVYGSSFVSMTEPDTRISLREGAFNIGAAFYPRKGCGEPLPGFSVLSAGGFTREAALGAALAGQLPAQDPATCSERRAEDTTVTIALRAAGEVSQLRCVGRRGDSSVRYREPPAEMPDLTNRVMACTTVPTFGEQDAEEIVELLVSTRSDESCKGLTHFVLRGCREDARCALPEWDIRATPPAWWPCTP